MEVVDPGVGLEGAVVGLEGAVVGLERGMAVGGRTVEVLEVEGKVVVEADLALGGMVVAALRGRVGAGASSETIKAFSSPIFSTT